MNTSEGLEWNIFEGDHGLQCYATWSNLDDYEEDDSFNVRVMMNLVIRL